MPPGPAYNWFCVANSALEVLNHAAKIKAAQLARSAVPVAGAAAFAGSQVLRGRGGGVGQQTGENSTQVRATCCLLSCRIAEVLV